MLFKRVAAILYDSLLVLALLILWTAFLLLFTHGQPIPATLCYRLSIILVIAAYFVGFWHHGGQTCGMKAWKLKIIDVRTHKNISYQQGVLRFLLAIPSCLLFGLGFFWMLLDKKNQTFYDRVIQTQCIPALQHNK